MEKKRTAACLKVPREVSGLTRLFVWCEETIIQKIKEAMVEEEDLMMGCTLCVEGKINQ